MFGNYSAEERSAIAKKSHITRRKNKRKKEALIATSSVKVLTKKEADKWWKQFQYGAYLALEAAHHLNGQLSITYHPPGYINPKDNRGRKPKKK